MKCLSSHVSDIKMLLELVQGDHSYWVLGGKGYRSKPLFQEFFEKQNIILHALCTLMENCLNSQKLRFVNTEWNAAFD